MTPALERLLPVFSCSRRECGNCNRESEKVELLSTQKPCCILYSQFNLWICLVGEVLVFSSFPCDLPACFLSLKLAWVNVWLCPLSPRIPLCNLINPFISLAPVYPMFPTNWEWISKKKKEEHVHNHRHLFTCLRKTTRFLWHRKKYWQKKKIASHLTAILSVPISSLNWKPHHSVFKWKVKMQVAVFLCALGISGANSARRVAEGTSLSRLCFLCVEGAAAQKHRGNAGCCSLAFSHLLQHSVIFIGNEESQGKSKIVLEGMGLHPKSVSCWNLLDLQHYKICHGQITPPKPPNCLKQNLKGQKELVQFLIMGP